MSLQVLIVAEDPMNDEDILKPLVRRMLVECGRPNAKVQLLNNPRTTGYAHAKGLLEDPEQALLLRYRHFGLILFLPDADGKDRSGEFRRLEERAAAVGVKLVCCAAIQEVEVWLLAGHVERLDRKWPEVRADVSVKENVFAPFLRKYGDARRAGGGRDLLMKDTLGNYRSLLSLCEELNLLEERIRAALSS